MHMAVSASNRIEVLLEISGATIMTAMTPSVAARRKIGGDNGRAATIARTIPIRKMTRFTDNPPDREGPLGESPAPG